MCHLKKPPHWTAPKNLLGIIASIILFPKSNLHSQVRITYLNYLIEQDKLNSFVCENCKFKINESQIILEVIKEVC